MVTSLDREGPSGLELLGDVANVATTDRAVWETASAARSSFGMMATRKQEPASGWDPLLWVRTGACLVVHMGRGG
jgi:hypothetical protein